MTMKTIISIYMLKTFVNDATIKMVKNCKNRKIIIFLEKPFYQPEHN